jgi:hypothetical protein
MKPILPPITAILLAPLVVMILAMNVFAQPYIPEEGSAELTAKSRKQRPAKVDSKAQATHPPAQSLFYKAQHPETGNMWDVWLYHHEGIYYLYYLANAGPKPPKGQPWNNISLATSPDGVNWTEKGPIWEPAQPGNHPPLNRTANFL